MPWHVTLPVASRVVPRRRSRGPYVSILRASAYDKQATLHRSAHTEALPAAQPEPTYVPPLRAGMVLPPAQLRLQGAPASSAMRALVLWCRVANIPVEVEKVLARA